MRWSFFTENTVEEMTDIALQLAVFARVRAVMTACMLESWSHNCFAECSKQCPSPARFEPSQVVLACARGAPAKARGRPVTSNTTHVARERVRYGRFRLSKFASCANRHTALYLIYILSISYPISYPISYLLFFYILSQFLNLKSFKSSNLLNQEMR